MWFIVDGWEFWFRSQNDLKHFQNGSSTQRFLPVSLPTLPFDHQLFSAHHELFSVCISFLQKTLIFWYFCIFHLLLQSSRREGFFSTFGLEFGYRRERRIYYYYSSQEVLHGRTTHDITNCTCPELQLRPHTTFS